MKKSLILLTSVVAFVLTSNAQDDGVSISVEGNAPDSTAILDVQSTSKGVLIPRLTAAERDAITAPATSLMIYNSTFDAFEYYDGFEWQTVGSDIGTSDVCLKDDRTIDFNSHDLIFDTGANRRFRIWNGGGNIDNALSFWDAGGGNMSTSFYNWRLYSGGSTLAMNIYYNAKVGFTESVGFGLPQNVIPNSARLHVRGQNATATKDAILVENSTELDLFRVLNNGQVAISSSSPDASSVLDINSTTGGLLIPRMTSVQRDAITNPATSLMIFNVTDAAYQYYDGSQWSGLGTGTTATPTVENIANTNLVLDSTRTLDFNGNDLIFDTGSNRKFRIWSGGANIDNGFAMWDGGNGNNKASFYQWSLYANNGNTQAMRIYYNGRTNFFENFGIGLSDGQTVTDARLKVRGLNSTGSIRAIKIENSSSDDLLSVWNNGQVAIGTATPESSAALQVNSTSGGFMPPKMTAAQASAITGVDGLMLYVTDTDSTFTQVGFWGYENGTWIKL